MKKIVEDDANEELEPNEEELTELYSRTLEYMLEELDEYESTEVAGVYVGIALRLYKTVLSAEDFNKIMKVIYESSDKVKVFKPQNLH